MVKKNKTQKPSGIRDTLSERPIKNTDFLSTGVTLVNLACTNHYKHGLLKGHVYSIVGESDSGKTVLALTILAEAARNRHFRNHRLIYDDTEGGALMNISKMYGVKLASRIQPPAWDDNYAKYSHTIEELYFNLDNALKDGPFVYVVDSMDGLSSEAENDKFEEQKKDYEKGRGLIGSYTDGKAKKNSAQLRRILGPLLRSGSIIILIRQTRSAMGRVFGDPVNSSGGSSLKFYATCEIWTGVLSQIKKVARQKEHRVGTMTKMEVKKNRIEGVKRRLYVPLYDKYGLDDIGACVDFLIAHNHWAKAGAKIKAPELDLVANKKQLIQHIDDNNLEDQIRHITMDLWAELEDLLKPKRKARYD